MSCAGADRLQTGMRGAFGKSYGKAARSWIGKIIFSMRCQPAHEASAVKAMTRAKAKFAGKAKVYVSSKWGFTKLSRADYMRKIKAGEL